MNFNHLFMDKNMQRRSTEQVDIKKNIKLLQCNNHDAKGQTVTTHLPKKKLIGEQLSKTTLSPNRPESLYDTFQQYRCKSNMLYEFENYLVYTKLLGEGSFSRVYLGESRKTKKLVAIKQVQKLQENEIACLMNSESPNIIRLYDFWSVDKFSYIALELCDGNLRDQLTKTSTEEKIIYFQQIVEGINYLNKKNIIHRDLKFENILLKNNTIKISDFGFAKPIGSKLAVFSEKCGTPYTMAPQIYFHNGQGKPVYSHKCDIYSLGVILHQMVYDRHPFDYSAQKMKTNNRVIVNKKFGVLDVLIDRCLEQQVARRCNWNQFMQVFTLFRMKKSHQNLDVLKERNKNLHEVKYQDSKYQKKPQTSNLLKFKKNIYQTPIRNQVQKQNCKQQKQNLFHKIKLPNKQEGIQKAEQKKSVNNNPKNMHTQSNLVKQKLKQQAWKIEHDHYFENDNQKENSVENQTISGVKLIFLVIAILTLMALLQKQFN